MYMTLFTLISVLMLSASGDSTGSRPQDRLPQDRLPQDRLPKVFRDQSVDLIEKALRREAAVAYQTHPVPADGKTWAGHREELLGRIRRASGFRQYPSLPLDLQETGRIDRKGYSIRRVAFRTRPGVVTTASLYVPEGKGPFPAVVSLHGHWYGGHTAEIVQSIGHTLALNGYVCLSPDAWGAAERSTDHENYEYHGSSLGASLMDVGETLLGMQLTDNIRAVDLLASLPYVDPARIGATGASGGGNQTMWLTAVDERIKACVPVVSVGTFEAYILNSNCVCELLPDGLTFTEEAGVLGLIAPRAMKICNAMQEANRSFFPSEMMRSYEAVQPLYTSLKARENLSYQLFNRPHGYWPEVREAMLGWFDLHLKSAGHGAPKAETPFELVPPEQLLVFPAGKRPAEVVTTPVFCRKQGEELRAGLLREKNGNSGAKRQELKQVLRLDETASIHKVHTFSAEDGWERLAIETTDGKLIPVLLRPGKAGEYVILTHPGGKDSLPIPSEYAGKGLVVVDLWGTGESQSALARSVDGQLPPFHTLARSALWLGRTVMGEWVGDLQRVGEYLRQERKATRLEIDGTKETGLAGLFYAALSENIAAVTLRESPASYLFDNRKTVDHFNMAIHLPGLLNWGDVSLAAALSQATVVWYGAVSISGGPVDPAKEYDSVRVAYKGQGKTIFKPATK